MVGASFQAPLIRPVPSDVGGRGIRTLALCELGNRDRYPWRGSYAGRSTGRSAIPASAKREVEPWAGVTPFPWVPDTNGLQRPGIAPTRRASVTNQVLARLASMA